MGIHWNIWLSEGGFYKKPIKRKDYVKRGLGQFADLRRACQERGDDGFWGAGVDTSMHIMLLDQTEGEWKAFLGGSRKGSHIVRLTPRALDCHKRRKNLSSCEIWSNSNLLCFLLHLLTDTLCKAWSSIINFWIDSRTYRK